MGFTSPQLIHFFVHGEDYFHQMSVHISTIETFFLFMDRSILINRVFTSPQLIHFFGSWIGVF